MTPDEVLAQALPGLRAIGHDLPAQLWLVDDQAVGYEQPDQIAVARRNLVALDEGHWWCQYLAPETPS